MNRLFVNLYFDEDVNPLIATLIKSSGLVSVTVHEAGRRGRSDEEQLLFATERQMAIIPHNRDHYLALAADFAKSGRHHCGIIIAVLRRPHIIAEKLVALLNNVSAEEMDDQVFYL